MNAGLARGAAARGDTRCRVGAHRRRPRVDRRLRRLVRDPDGAVRAGAGGRGRAPRRPRPGARRGGRGHGRPPWGRLVPRARLPALGPRPRRHAVRGRAPVGGAGAHRAPRPDRPLDAPGAPAGGGAARPGAGEWAARARTPRPVWPPRPGGEVLHDCVVALGDGAPARALLAAAVGEETDVDAETMRILLGRRRAGGRRRRRADAGRARAPSPAGRPHRDLRRAAALPGGCPRARRNLRPREGARAARRAGLRRRAAASTATGCSTTSGPSWRPSAGRAPSTPPSTSCAAPWSRWRRRARAAR